MNTEQGREAAVVSLIGVVLTAVLRFVLRRKPEPPPPVGAGPEAVLLIGELTRQVLTLERQADTAVEEHHRLRTEIERLKHELLLAHERVDSLTAPVDLSDPLGAAD